MKMILWSADWAGGNGARVRRYYALRRMQGCGDSLYFPSLLLRDIKGAFGVPMT